MVPFRSKSTSLGRIAQGQRRKILGGKSAERQKTVRPGQSWEHEPVEAVLDRPSDDLREGADVASVGSLERTKVPVAVAFEDDRRWIPLAHQEEVHRQSAGPSVAIPEGMDPLEPIVRLGHEPEAVLLGRRSGRHGTEPVRDEGRDSGNEGGFMPPGNAAMSCCRKPLGPSPGRRSSGG